MIVVVDERELVKDGYTSLFGREGIPSTGFDPVEFGEWVSTAADSDLAAVEAFLIGQGDRSFSLPKAIRDRTTAPVIAVSDQPSLESTLALFDSGVDDVVRKPVHPREILARAGYRSFRTSPMRVRSGFSLTVAIPKSAAKSSPCRAASDASSNI